MVPNQIALTTKNYRYQIYTTLYITLSPCKDCSKLVLQSGIKRVVYMMGYKDTAGIDFLEAAGIETKQISDIANRPE